MPIKCLSPHPSVPSTRAASNNPADYDGMLLDVAPRLRRRVRGMLRRFRSFAVDCEDVVQETLLALHAGRNRWNPSLPFEAWATAIAKNKTIDAVRRSCRIAACEAEYAACGQCERPEETLSHLDCLKAVGLLGERERRLLERVSLEGQSVADVASDLGLSTGNARVIMHRAIKRLGRQFQVIRAAAADESRLPQSRRLSGKGRRARAVPPA